MAIHGEWIRFGRNNESGGYLARPDRAAGTLPAVIVLQEIWGVDAHIEDVTRRFAGAGYVAFAPDLYVEGGGERPSSLASARIAETQDFINEAGFAVLMDQAARAAALGSRPEVSRKHIEETMSTLFAGLTTGGLKVEKYIPTCLEAARFLREECAYSKGQKIASVGYCMGGGLAALFACSDPLLAGSVIYYGSAPEHDELARISCPVLGFYGSLDERVNSGIPAFAESMKKLGKNFEYEIYAGAQHAFFNDGRPSYDPKASRDAFLKTLQFLRRTLLD